MVNTIELLESVKTCRLCENELPLNPKPIFQFDTQAKILIAGQAPGIKAHEAGIAFADASGERLRQWLGVGSDTFYNAKNFAILPMGFCYPGKGKTGDLPPKPECAEKWRQALLAELNQLQLTLIVGQYAWRYHAEFLQALYSESNPQNISEAIKLNANYLPEAFILPHPSPRNNIWLKRNAWFETEQLDKLQARVQGIVNRS